MTLSGPDLNIILAALRYSATAHEEIAKMFLSKGDRNKAMQHGGFAARCGQLSDEIEKQAKGRIIRPQ